MDPGVDQPLRFGTFELDVRSRELRTGSKRVRLQEQPFEILRLMLERPGHVVTREELRRQLWPEGTFVDYEHSLNAAVKRLRAVLGDDAENPRYVETLPRRGYRFIGAVVQEPEPAAAPGRVRLAVLPFVSLSEGTGDDYFSDGLTEEMIAQLGRICRGRLAIIARHSSMRFKGTTCGARQIGEALRAQYLLEGSVREEAGRVRIAARLVETTGETQLWADTYERELNDCFGVQADVSVRIAESLALELLPDNAPVCRSPADAAYQEFLKARFFWNKLDDEREAGAASSLDQALACLTRALQVERDYAPAHALAGRVHVARAQQYLTVPREALTLGGAAAIRALQLDPGLTEAHLAIADVRRLLEWDWRGAEAAYRQAIAVNPSQSYAHRRYSLMLASEHRREEAVREAERACELDPLCLVTRVTGGLVYYFTGGYDRAIGITTRILELAPEYFPARRLLAAACLQVGRTGDARRELEAYAEATGAPIAVTWLAHALAVSGDVDAARAAFDRWRARNPARTVPPYHLALMHAGLGDVDAAFDALDEARAQKDPAIVFAAVEPRLGPLHADPRYVQLMSHLGL